MVHRQVCIQRTHNGGLGMADLESHWLVKRLAYLGWSLTGDMVWRRKVSRSFPHLNSNPKAKGWHRPMSETPFVHECCKALRKPPRSSDLSWPQKELYRELEMGSISEALSEWCSWTAEEIHSHWNWVPGFSFLNNSEFSLTRRLAQNPLPLLSLNFRVGIDMPDCACCGSGLEEMAEHTFYCCDRVHPFWDHVREWTAHIELLNVGYIVDVLPPFQGEKCVVFLVILAVARMVIWMTWNKGLYDDKNFSHHNLVLYFRHQLMVKIRYNRKCLDHKKFDKRWVNAASLVVRKGVMLESSFPPLPAHGIYGPDSSGPYYGLVDFVSPLISHQQFVVSHHPLDLIVSLQDLLHPNSFYTSNPHLSPFFSEDLGTSSE